jgi:hypothetical protein
LLASPKKARNVTFDGPSPSQAVPGTPSKTTSTLSLLNVNSGTGNEDAEEDLSPNHLVDATGVTDLDLSADFDVNEISRMLADEQVEGKGVTDSDDKVLVSIRFVSSHILPCLEITDWSGRIGWVVIFVV